MPKITVDITPEGETTVKVEGQHGPGCKELTRAIEAAIGQTTGDRLTPEFHRSAAQKTGRQQEQRG